MFDCDIGLFVWHFWPGLDLVRWDAAAPDVAAAAQRPVDALSQALNA
jgi:hypothetical protein